MPQPKNRVTGEQWQTCDRCGRLFPMSKLVKQKGLLVCTNRLTCFDDLTVERKDMEIEQALNTGVDQEGADTRQADRGFFEGFDDGVR